MKPLTLAVTFLLSIPALAETVLLRAAGVSLHSYQESLRTSVSRITPMMVLEQRLRNEELPATLRDQLDLTLASVARKPEQSTEEFEKLYLRLEEAPRSAAVRDAMRMVLDRLQGDPTKIKSEWLTSRRDLLRASSTDQRGTKSSFLHSEIHERIKVLRQRPGGEDLQLYWNGIKWDQGIAVTPEQVSQWTVISSQWQPRSLNGTWSEVSPQLQEPFVDWVLGSCDQPEFRSLSIGGSANLQALFPANCLAKEGESSVQQKPQVMALKTSRTHWSKPVMYGGGAVATALVFLMVSGKKIRFR